MLHSNSFPSTSGNCPEGYETASTDLDGAGSDTGKFILLRTKYVAFRILPFNFRQLSRGV